MSSVVGVSSRFWPREPEASEAARDRESSSADMTENTQKAQKTENLDRLQCSVRRTVNQNTIVGIHSDWEASIIEAQG